MNGALIQVSGLGHTYLRGTPHACRALRDVDFAVAAGEIALVLGGTGSGKSTLLQHLNGLILPQEGTVHVAGADLADGRTDLLAVRRQVGLVFQRSGDQLFERYVGDDVAYGPRLAGLRGPELRERVRWAMEMAGLDFELFKDRPIFALSGGERRKAGLAGVLALRPGVLVLDEPTAGLDPVSHQEFLLRLAALRRDGMTLVISTHDMDDAAALADHVTVLCDGEVVRAGSSRVVFTDTATLGRCGLAPPQPALLVAALHDRGWGDLESALTADQAETVILAALGAAQ